jgi:hypothetical protein
MEGNRVVDGGKVLYGDGEVDKDLFLLLGRTMI